MLLGFPCKPRQGQGPRLLEPLQRVPQRLPRWDRGSGPPAPKRASSPAGLVRRGLLHVPKSGLPVPCQPTPRCACLSRASLWAQGPGGFPVINRIIPVPELRGWRSNRSAEPVCRAWLLPAAKLLGAPEPGVRPVLAPAAVSQTSPVKVPPSLPPVPLARARCFERPSR